ncbi:SICAvar, type I (fragment), partial [Plasmodium knowlesi strain H]
MVDGVAGPAQADPCSATAQQSPEIQQSDQNGRGLREKWRNYLSSHSGAAGQPVQAVTIPDDLKKEVDKMLDGMKPYLQGMNSTGSVARACEKLKAPGEENRNGGPQTGNMKRVCKTLVQVVNWMGGLNADGSEKNKKDATAEQEWEQYLRCVIGYEVLLRVLLPKYKVEEFMKVISKVMRDGGSEGNLPNVNNICSWVKLEDIGNEEGSIGSLVQDWLNKAKDERMRDRGYIDGFHNIVAWSRYDNEEDKQKEMAERRAKTPCSSDSIMDLMKEGMSHQLNVLVDPIAVANDCIEKAENNGKDKALCNRLKCIEEYLQETTTTPATTAGAQAGAGRQRKKKEKMNTSKTTTTEENCFFFEENFFSFIFFIFQFISFFSSLHFSVHFIFFPVQFIFVLLNYIYNIYK